MLVEGRYDPDTEEFLGGWPISATIWLGHHIECSPRVRDRLSCVVKCMAVSLALMSWFGFYAAFLLEDPRIEVVAQPLGSIFPFLSGFYFLVLEDRELVSTETLEDIESGELLEGEGSLCLSGELCRASERLFGRLLLLSLGVGWGGFLVASYGEPSGVARRFGVAGSEAVVKFFAPATAVNVALRYLLKKCRREPSG